MSITRRTKQEKENPHHHFTLSWQPIVKGHFKNEPNTQTRISFETKSADRLAKGDEFEATRRDIIKTLILAGFILGLEVVLYLGWFRNLS